MQHYKAHSNVIPPEWDIQSSETTAYHNYNVVEISNEDGQVLYEYDVDKMTHQEYNIHLQEQLTQISNVLDQVIITSLEG